MKDTTSHERITRSMGSIHVFLFFAVIGLLLFLAPDSHAAQVNNFKPKQQGKDIVITYDISGDKGETETEIMVVITLDGKEYRNNDLHLKGDYGRVKVGKNKKIIWNVVKDFPGGFDPGRNWGFEVTVDQGRVAEYEKKIQEEEQKRIAELNANRVDFTDPATGMKFVLVKGGCYDMGDSELSGKVHQVCVSDFYLGKYEVTQGQWQAIMGNNPSHFKGCGDTCPVEQVSWNDAQEFIQKLNSSTGKSYRLPTEAEWEYAARSGGKREKFAGTSSDSSLGSYAWYESNSSSQTHPVGQKQPNSLGLYDMSGNVWEWCHDWYDKNYYSNSPKDNPQGPSSGSLRVQRGGSWYFIPQFVRASNRFSSVPSYRFYYVGFRLLRTP